MALKCNVISISLPDDLLDGLDRKGEALERGRSWVVQRALRLYLSVQKGVIPEAIKAKEQEIEELEGARNVAQTEEQQNKEKITKLVIKCRNLNQRWKDNDGEWHRGRTLDECATWANSPAIIKNIENAGITLEVFLELVRQDFEANPSEKIEYVTEDEFQAKRKAIQERGDID